MPDETIKPNEPAIEDQQICFYCGARTGHTEAENIFSGPQWAACASCAEEEGIEPYG
jgi:hypothetical protein